MPSEQSHMSANVKDGIRYDVLGEEDLRGAIKCIMDTFAGGDPLSRAVGLAPADLGGFINIFLGESLVADGLSVVARDVSSGAVAGCLLAQDFLSEPPASLDGLSPKMLPVLAILEALDSLFLADAGPHAGEILHVLMTGVAPGFNNRMVAGNLLARGYEIAKARKIRAAVAEVTGAKSQHVAARFGAKTIYEIRYADFIFKGNRPFASITDTESIKLMYIDL